MTESAIILAADFSRGGRTHPPILTIYAIKDGQRHGPTSQIVKDKREARKIALSQGAKPWNF